MLATCVTVPAYDPTQESGDVWIVPADGSAAPRRLTSGHGLKATQSWSPDGSQLAFVTKAAQDQRPQIYVIPVGGGDARRVTDQPDGHARRNGDRTATRCCSKPAPRRHRLAVLSPHRIYDAMPVRFWNRWLDEHRPHPFVLELRDGATALPRSTCCTARASPTTVFTSLFQVPATGGEPMALTAAGESFSDPQFTRGGEALYAIRKRWATDYVSTRLAKLSWPAPSGATVVTGQWERVIKRYALSSDGQTIYLDAADDGLQRVFSMPAAGGRPEPVMASQSGAWRAFTPVAGGVVALFETALQPPELVRLGTPPVPLTRFNAERLAQIDAPDPIHFRFTASHGKRIHNVLFRPAGFDPAAKYPIVTLIHGGPASMATDAFTYSAFWFHPHLLATPGYVVLVTKYTGSIGFGERFAVISAGRHVPPAVASSPDLRRLLLRRGRAHAGVRVAPRPAVRPGHDAVAVAGTARADRRRADVLADDEAGAAGRDAPARGRCAKR